MRVTEALHLRAFGRYMVRALCYIKPTHFFAVVSVHLLETQLLWIAGVYASPKTILCWPTLCSFFGVQLSQFQ